MIRTDEEYNAACEKIDKLLEVVGSHTPATDKNFIKLDLLSDSVADYEEAKFPVKEPTVKQPKVIPPHILERIAAKKARKAAL